MCSASCSLQSRLTLWFANRSERSGVTITYFNTRINSTFELLSRLWREGYKCGSDVGVWNHQFWAGSTNPSIVCMHSTSCLCKRLTRLCCRDSLCRTCVHADAVKVCACVYTWSQLQIQRFHSFTEIHIHGTTVMGLGKQRLGFVSSRWHIFLRWQSTARGESKILKHYL